MEIHAQSPWANRIHVLELIALLSLALVALMSLTVISDLSDADANFTVEGLSYKVTSYTDMTVDLVENIEVYYSGDINVPSTVTHDGGTFTVSGVYYAFSNNANVTSVILPDTVTKIDCAFYNCSHVTSIDLGNSLHVIPSQAFYMCKMLETVTMHNVTSIGAEAFYFCQSIVSIDAGNDVKIIGEKAFYNCYHLSNIIGGENIESIGTQAFANCYGLISVNVCKVISVPDEAFSNCSKLSSVRCSTDLTTIGEKAFYDCRELISILDAPNIVSVGDSAFKNCHKLTTIDLSKVNEIGNESFYACDGLSTVSLDCVETIGDSAFYHCDSLSSVNMPNIVSMGTRVFSGCGIVSAYFGDKITKIADYAFQNDDQLREVKLSDSLIEIGTRAFDSCNLYSIKLPSTLKTIGQNAFAGTKVLEICNDSTIVLTPGSTEQGRIAAKAVNIYSSDSGSSILKELTLEDGSICIYYEKNDTLCLSRIFINSSDIVLPDSIESKPYKIEEYLFQNTTLTSVKLGENTTSIGSFLFIGCTNLISVVINDSIDKLPIGLFYNCCSLEEITLPSGLKTIGASAFTNCTSLRCINIPDSVKSIGSKSFEGCSSLLSITFGTGITTIDSTAFTGFTFYDTDGTTSLTPDVENLKGNAFIGTEITKMVKDTSMYTVNFYDENGVLNTTRSYSSGQSVKEFDVSISKEPTEQYSFIQNGWKYMDGTPVTFPIVISSDLSLCPTYENTPRLYSVNYYVDDELIETKSCEYGSKFINKIISKDSTAQYQYIFVGWKDSNNSIVRSTYTITGDLSVTAEFSKNLRQYLIKFVDYDGTCIQSGYYKYGSTIVAPADPTRDADDYYNYIFEYWDGYTAEMTVVEQKTFTAVYAQSNIVYTVTYRVDSTDVFADMYQYQEIVTLRSNYEQPGVQSTAWCVPVEVIDGKFTMPNHNVLITATTTVVKYNVTFWNEGVKLSSYKADLNSSVHIPNDIPSKVSTEQFNFVFEYWANEDGTKFNNDIVTSDLDYYAVYTIVINSYDVIFMNGGSQYAYYKMSYGMEFVPPSVDPVKAQTSSITYTFAGWYLNSDGTGETVTGGTVTGNITLYAMFTSSDRIYDVIYKNENAVLFTDHYTIGTEVTLREPYAVTGYTTSWSPTATATGGKFTMPEADVIVSLVLEPNTYSIKFYDEDKDTVLYDGIKKYNENMPVFTPVKESTAQFEYSFAGWTDVNGTPITVGNIVTSDVTAYASYTDSTRSYYVLYYSDVGSLIQSGVYDYGTVITPIAGPVKDSDGMFTYTFNSWYGYSEGMTVQGRTVFTAVYDKTPIISDGSEIVIYAAEDEFVKFTDDNIEDLKEKAKTEDVSLTVTVSEGTIVFDKEAIKTFTGGNDLSISKLDNEKFDQSIKDIVGDAPTYEIYFGENRNFGEGSATITIPYTLKEGDDPNNLVVYYLQDGRVAQRIDCTYENGYVTFVTNHFSTYAIVSEEASGDSGSNIGLIIGAAVAGLAAVLIAAAIIVKKH